MKENFFIFILIGFSITVFADTARDYRLPPSSLPSGWSLLNEGEQSLDTKVQRTRIRKEVFQELGFQDGFVQIFNTPDGRASLEIELYSGSKGPRQMLDIEKQLLTQQRISYQSVTICGKRGIKASIYGVHTYIFNRDRCFYLSGSMSESLTKTLADLLCGSTSTPSTSPQPSKSPEKILIALAVILGLSLLAGIAKLIKSRAPHKGTSERITEGQPGPQLDFGEPEPADSSQPVLQFEGEGPRLDFDEAEQQEPEKEEERKPAKLILKSNVQEVESNGRDKAELKAQVLDLLSAPLAGQVVEFEAIDGGTITPLGKYTDSVGQVKALFLAEPGSEETYRLGALCPDYPDVYDSIFVKAVSVRPVAIHVTAEPEKLPADGKTPAKILAKVTGKNGEPVPDANVYFSTNQEKSLLGLRRRLARTGDDGIARNEFTMDEDVQGDSVEVTAVITRYKNKEYHPTLEGWCKIQVLTNAVVGTVKDQQGNPIEGAVVDLKNMKEDWYIQEKTGPGGEFRFEDWNPGEYEIGASKRGCEEGEKSRTSFFLERSGTIHIDLELIVRVALELLIDPEALEANGKDQAEIRAKLLDPENKPIAGETIIAQVEGEKGGRIEPGTAATDEDGEVLFNYTASQAGGEFRIRARLENQSDVEAIGTIKQEAYPYFDVDFADRIIRVYKKEEARSRTRGLTIADIQKVRLLRTDRETPFPGTVSLDRFLVAAVYAVFGTSKGDFFYLEQMERCRKLAAGSKELSFHLEKQRYDADWYKSMARGMTDFKQYVDIVVMLISPPDPLKTARTILSGGAKGLLTAFNLLLGVYSEMDKANAKGEGWFSSKEWLDKELCMDKMRESFNQQIAALDRLADTAGELEKSWQQIQPGSDAPNLLIQEVIPLEVSSQSYQVLYQLWKYLAAERTRLWYYAQWKRTDSPPQLDSARAILDLHEEYMQEQKAEAKKIETMAKEMKSLAT